MPPTYEYACPDHTWDVVKPMAAIDHPEACPACGRPGERQVTLPAPVSPTAGDWNRGEFNPGLGCHTKSWKHARQIAKARGLEEVGTEPVEKIHQRFDRQREETAAQRWADADRDKLYD